MFDLRHWLSALVIVGVCCGFATWSAAQSGSDSKTKSNQPAKKRPATTQAELISMTPERQAAALKFAELHHPELHRLLVRLSKAKRTEYQKAVRQLYNDSERLARYKQRGPERYGLVLKEWQIESRLRLLVARMTMTVGDPVLEEQLSRLLKQRIESRLAILKYDRERQAARLERLDSQIEEMESNQDGMIEKELARIQRSLGVPKPSPKRDVKLKTNQPPRSASRK